LLCIQRVFNLKYKPFAFRALSSLNIEQPFSEDSENNATSHANAKSQNHTVRIYKLCRLTLAFIISACKSAVKGQQKCLKLRSEIDQTGLVD